MEYIEKQNIPPENWGSCFVDTNNIRVFDYTKAQTAELKNARIILLKEQYYLCAYCQSKITIDNSSIEHVIPKSLNLELSTNYHNLVAVCKNQIKDENGRLHCDQEKESLPIVPYIFSNKSSVSELRNNDYFKVYSTGEIVCKDELTDEVKKQVKSFIEILNLNHKDLRKKREKHIDVLTDVYKSLPKNRKSIFWKNKLKSALNNYTAEYRHALMIFCASKAGIN